MSILDDLYAERYGCSLWWTTPEPPPDTELDQATRRRVLDEAFRASEGERGVA